MLTSLITAFLLSMSAHATAVVYESGPFPGPRTCESLLTNRTPSSEKLLNSMHAQTFRFEGRTKNMSQAESAILGLKALDEIPTEERSKVKLSVFPAVGGGTMAKLVGPGNTTLGALVFPVQKLKMWYPEESDATDSLLGVGYTSEPNSDGVRSFIRVSNWLRDTVLVGIDFPCELAASFTKLSKVELEFVRTGNEVLCRRILYSFVGTGLPNK